MSSNKFAEKFQGKTSKIGKDGFKSMFGIADIEGASDIASNMTPVIKKPYQGKP